MSDEFLSIIGAALESLDTEQLLAHYPSLDYVGKQSLLWDIVRTPRSIPDGSLDKGEKYEQLEISS